MAKETAYDHALKRTVSIHDGQDDSLLGSGAICSRDGHVLTCAHVVLGHPNRLYVRTSDNRHFPVDTLREYELADLAVLKCRNAHDLPFFTINTTILDIDRDVLVIGFPNEQHLSSGYFRKTKAASRTTVRRVGDTDLPVWGISDRNIILAGMSGGAVVDLLTRELVGLLFGYDKGLEKAHYDTSLRFSGFELRRRDDLFMPMDFVASQLEVDLHGVLTMNTNANHMRMLEQSIDILDLLGFRSRLIDVHDNHRYAIHSSISVGIFTFELLVLVFPGQDRVLDQTELHKLLDDVTIYERTIGGVVEKKCVIIEGVATNEVRHLAESSGLEILNSEDLFTSFIDLTEYLENAKLQWTTDRAGISSRYIDLKARRLVDGRFVPVESIEEYFGRWIRQTHSKPLLVLGKYGSGKTTVLRRAFFRLASDNLDGTSNLVPVLVRLAKARNSTLRQIMKELAEEELGVLQKGNRVITRLVDLGKLVLLFDGFDEMSEPGATAPSYLNTRELSNYLAGNSKVMVSCRAEYFTSSDDFDAILASPEFGALHKSNDFDVLIVEDLDPDQVKEYVQKSASLQDTTSALSLISENASLSELACRPILLDMIIFSLPALQAGSKASIAELYSRYIEQWLDRDIRFGRTSEALLGKRDRLEIMNNIAAEMHRRGSLTLDYDEIEPIITDFFGGNHSKAHFHMHDVLANSFLVRNDRDQSYEFSHKSFFEYFLAQRLVKEVLGLLAGQSRGKTIFGERRLSFAVIQLMLDMGLSEQHLWLLIERTRGAGYQNMGYIGGNAITALRLLGSEFRGKNFDNTVLAGADFSGLDLTGSSFHDAVLLDTGFGNAILDDVKMQGADLTRADLKQGTSIYALAYSDSSNRIAFAGFNNRHISVVSVNQTDAPSSTMLSLHGIGDNVCTVSFIPNGRKLLSAGQDFYITVWDLDTALEVGRLRGHYGDVWNVRALSNREIVSCSLDGQVIKWDIDRLSATKVNSSTEELWGMDVDLSLGMIATGTVSGKIVLLDKELSIINQLDIPHMAPVRVIRFFAGHGVLCSGHHNGAVHVWDFVSGTERSISVSDSAVKSLDISERSGMLAVGTEDGVISLTRVSDTSHFRHIHHAHMESVAQLVYSNDETTLFSAGHDGSIAAWNASTDDLIWRVHEVFVNNRFSCRNLRLAGTQGISIDRLRHLVQLGAEFV